MATVAAPAVFERRSAWGLLALGAVGTVAAALTAADVGDGSRDADVLSVLRGLIVASYTFVGVYTAWRRPGDRFGLYLAAVGIVYSVSALAASSDATAHTVGRTVHAGFVVGLVYVFLCFPHDRLGSARERRLVTMLAATTAVLWAVALPLVEKLPAGGPLVDCASACPGNAARIVEVPHAVSDGIGLMVSLVTAVGLVGVVVALGRKARSPARLRRRLVVPLLACIVALTVNYAVYTVLREADVAGTEALKVSGAITALAIPLAMLLGQVRGRVFAATSLGQLVARVGREPVTPARVEELLREALGDPLLTLALREPGGGAYVDVRGAVVAPPIDRRDAGVTWVTREGEPVAVLIHDTALDETPGVTEGLAATSLMLLENARLVDELQASRERIVSSAQQERLRLERNLHDGAQQRLFAIQLGLHAARERSGAGELAHELDELATAAAAAVEELRELAHGLYPTVLRERGLADALRAVAGRAAVPVRVVDGGVGRCSATVEEAVYFTALEAIQNAAKHAGAGARVTVTLERRGSDLAFAIVDDGAGFAPGADAGGLGLVSMRDRIGAVGGWLELVTGPAAGTTVRGVVPGACA